MAIIKKTPKSIEELENHDARKTEFFLAASHQLKSPVAIIQWCLQSVMELGRVDNKSNEMVRKAMNQANIMSQLIADMLHVFHLMNRKGSEREFSQVNINQLLRQVLEDYEPIAHMKGVHLVKGPMEVLPKVLAEEPYLKQVFVNLIDNAIKYSSSGGTVSVSCQVAKGGYAEIVVQDNGIGISEVDQAKLFTEFFRTPEAREITSEGTGLGLVLVKRIVEEFGGEVKVKSALHKGSVFTVRLPTC